MLMTSKYVGAIVDIMGRLMAKTNRKIKITTASEGVAYVLYHETTYELVQVDEELVLNMVNSQRLEDAVIVPLTEGVTPADVAVQLASFLGVTTGWIPLGLEAIEVDEDMLLYKEMVYLAGCTGNEICETSATEYERSRFAQAEKTMLVTEGILPGSWIAIAAYPELNSYEDNHDFRRYLEAEGKKTFITDIRGLEKGLYIDTPENREACRKAIAAYPKMSITEDIKGWSEGRAYMYYEYLSSLSLGYKVTTEHEYSEHLSGVLVVVRDDSGLYATDAEAAQAAMLDGVMIINDDFTKRNCIPRVCVDLPGNREVLEANVRQTGGEV